MPDRLTDHSATTPSTALEQVRYAGALILSLVTPGRTLPTCQAGPECLLCHDLAGIARWGQTTHFQRGRMTVHAQWRAHRVSWNLTAPSATLINEATSDHATILGALHTRGLKGADLTAGALATVTFLEALESPRQGPAQGEPASWWDWVLAIRRVGHGALQPEDAERLLATSAPLLGSSSSGRVLAFWEEVAKSPDL